MKRILWAFLALFLALGQQVGAKTPPPAPLTGTVTPQNWVTSTQSFPGITLQSGLPFAYNLLPPAQYSPSQYVYPLLVWLHSDFEGDIAYQGGSCSNLQNLDPAQYNTVSFLTRYPAFILAPCADQTSGNDAVENWGGWFNNGQVGSGTVYSGDTGPNVYALIALIGYLETQYSIDPNRIYVHGTSLGGIGSEYLLYHYNAYNGDKGKIFASGSSTQGVDEADAPPGAAAMARMQSVPVWWFSGVSDGQSPPNDWNSPLCTLFGGNPANMTAITSASANQCGTSAMRYTLCPTCGHQSTDANGNPVWTNTTMMDFMFAQTAATTPPPPPPVTAQRSGDFLNVLAINGCLTGGGAPSCLNASQQVADLQYLGITHYRTGTDITLSGASLTSLTALLNAGITLDTGTQYSDPLVVATNISQMHAFQAINPNAIWLIEGLNEPELFNTHYNGAATGGTGNSWLGVAQFSRDSITAILADGALKNVPLAGVSRPGAEPDNAGLQFATIQGNSSLLPNGTVLGNYLNNHIYPTDQQFLNGSVNGACQPNDPTAGNSFQLQMHYDNVSTFHAGFSGYASDAAAKAIPHVVTEFGYPITPGPSPNGDNVTDDKRGRCIMNGLLVGWNFGEKAISIYSLYDTQFGMFTASAAPTVSGTYLHNFTSALADAGATSRTFTPGSLSYTLTGASATTESLLFETSTGHYKLVIWRDDTNWNLAAGTAITVAPINVTVTLGTGTAAFNQYDPTIGTSPQQTLASAAAITVPVADYPQIIDILPAGTAPVETIGVNTIQTQTATQSFVVTGTIANVTAVPTLQYQVDNNGWLSLPVSGNTRSEYDQPGSNNSVWNTPFGNGAVWGAATDADTIAISQCVSGGVITTGPCGYINTTANFGQTMYTSQSASDPTFTFSSTNNGRTIAPDNGSTITATMHVPAGAITAGPYSGGGDNQLELQDPINYPHRVYAWRLGNVNGVAPPGLQAGQGPFAGNQGEWDDTSSDIFGQDWDSGQSGFNVAAGLIRGCDTTPSCNPFYPLIKHGLEYATDIALLKSNNNGNTGVLNPSGWPDRLEDAQSGGSVYSGNLLYGTTLGIPITTTMPSGLDANCQGFFWTMQHYPLFVRNAAGGGLHLGADQIADVSPYLTSIRSCFPQLATLLRPLRNQHLGGQSFTTNPANGPGARVDTGPYPLAGGTGSQVTLTSYFFTVPGIAQGTHTIQVRDANNTSVVGTSNQFLVQGSSGLPTGTPKAPLSSGYFTSSGNQIQDGAGNNVRLACTLYDKPTGNVTSDMTLIRGQGFNCIRRPYFDKATCPSGVCNFSVEDPIVAAATASSLRVIFDHQGNETVSACNGLWYDKNGTAPYNTTNNTDGCGNTGTVTYAQFKANWVSIATHYNGNQAVIGFDLHNEPTSYTNTSCCNALGANWNGANPNGANPAPSPGNGSDLKAMAEDVGAAIKAVNSNAMIIVEGIISNCLNGATLSNGTTTCGGGGGAPPPPGTTAVSQIHNKTDLLAYLNSLKGKGAISGEYTALNAPGDVEGIITKTGKRIGAVGIDYYWFGARLAPANSSDNATAREWWSNGGLVILNTHMGTPSTTPSGAPNNGGVYDVPCSNNPFTATINWNDLTTANGNATNNNLNAGLDGIAAGILDLANSGISIIYRPYHESDGCWFWWGTNSNTDISTGSQRNPTTAQFIKLWRYTHDYISAKPGPAGSGNTLGAYIAWAFTGIDQQNGVLDNYPDDAGGNYVDIVGDDIYTDAPGTDSNHAARYNTEVATGKTVIVAEFGPVNMPFDQTLWTNAIQNDYPAVVFWQQWDGGSWSMNYTSNTGAALSNPYILNAPLQATSGGGGGGGGGGGTTSPNMLNDLTAVGTTPVVCCSGKVIYSVHDFPNSAALDTGIAGQTVRTNTWGYLVAQNQQPIWLGSMGASLDNSNGALTNETAWATNLTSYINGGAGAQGGPVFSGCQQPMGASWADFGNNPTSTPNGTLNTDGATNKSGQATYWSQLLYTTCSGTVGVGSTTWNPNDLLNMALSGSNTVATTTGLGSVRSTTSQSTGKVCAEVTANTITSNWTLGLANSSFALGTGSGVGSDSNAIGIDPNSNGAFQGVFFNNVNTGGGGSNVQSTNGDRVTICADLGAKLFWATDTAMRSVGGATWNSSAAANPATGVGGASFAGLTGPYFIIFNDGDVGGIATLNTTGPFAVSTPAGFSAWTTTAITAGSHATIIGMP